MDSYRVPVKIALTYEIKSFLTTMCNVMSDDDGVYCFCPFFFKLNYEDNEAETLYPKNMKELKSGMVDILLDGWIEDLGYEKKDNLI